MSEAGFNVVRLAEFAWSKMEPAEGKYDFEWLDRAMVILQAYGIQVVLGTPTASPPPWLMSKSPDPKEKAEQFSADKEIQALLAEINADDGSMSSYFGQYTPEKAASLKAHPFDRFALGQRGMKYERLDQLTVDLLLGVR